MVFKSSGSSMFYKKGVLKNFTVHMKAPEICNSDKKRLQCGCFPENFPKLLAITFYKTPLDECFWTFIHLKQLNYFLPSNELMEINLFIYANMFYLGFQA